MSKEQFENWALIELFGHQRIAGKVTEQQVGGCSFVRVDVPETKSHPAYSKLFGNGAIYAITITDEDTARKAAEYYEPAPMDKWTIDDVLQKVKLLGEGPELEPETTEEEDNDPCNRPFDDCAICDDRECASRRREYQE